MKSGVLTLDSSEPCDCYLSCLGEQLRKINILAAVMIGCGSNISHHFIIALKYVHISFWAGGFGL